MLPLLLVLTGPTGVGKTELSLRLAERYECPILNADSRQLYRDLPIGTAAPTAAEQARVPHYFVGTHDLDDECNAGTFEREVLRLLGTLPQPTDPARPIAILSGGAMLYIDAVCHGLDDIPAVPEAIRRQVQEGYRTHGLTWLQQEVQRLDPDYYTAADTANPQRLMHCMEVCLATGGTYSALRTQQHRERPFRVVKVMLDRPREELYRRINSRCEQMMRDGLLAEATAAFRRYDGQELPNALRTVAYNELYRFYTGEWTLDKALDMMKQNTRHYAKRQLTWWRRDNQIHRLDANTDYETQIATIEHWLHAAGGM